MAICITTIIIIFLTQNQRKTINFSYKNQINNNYNDVIVLQCLRVALFIYLMLSTFK